MQTGIRPGPCTGAALILERRQKWQDDPCPKSSCHHPRKEESLPRKEETVSVQESVKMSESWQGMVAQAGNSSYLGGRDLEDPSLRLVWAASGLGTVALLSPLT
jgi:hypothetical protein